MVNEPYLIFGTKLGSIYIQSTFSWSENEKDETKGHNISTIGHTGQVKLLYIN